MIVGFSKGEWYLELSGEKVATLSDTEVTKELKNRHGSRPRTVAKQLFGAYILEHLNDTREFLLKQAMKG